MSQTLIVAKFGGTSVADFEAMNRSADVVLQDASTRLVVLSASAGITNLLVALAEGQQAPQRAVLLDDIRRIQYAIVDRLQRPEVIRDEIDRMIDNISMLSEAASLATSNALTDELVSHGELMSSLLFVEILRERQVNAEWFDVRKVMRTDDHFGRQYLMYRCWRSRRRRSYSRALSRHWSLLRVSLAVKAKGAPPPWVAAAVITPPLCWAKR